MKNDQVEVAAVEKIVLEKDAAAELNQLELTLAGGGTGEVVWS